MNRMRFGRGLDVLFGAAVAASLALICSDTALAQAVPDNAYSALHWRLIGPFRGGRTLAVSGIPGDPRTFYFGSVDGGVWRSGNAGVTWEPLFDGQPIASIGALAIAQSDSRVIYVGTGEADMRSDITFGAGVYRSADGGAHWEQLGLDDSRHIGKILIDPGNPDLVWVAALGHAYGPNEERGVFRSADGGRTWQKVLYRNPDVGAIDLAFDPDNSQVVYAALWNARRSPWSQYPPNQGPGSGIFKTNDGGKTWSEIAGHGLPASPLGRIGLAVARSHGARVYALIDARQGGGLYRSDDAGGTWQRVSTDPRITARGWYFGQVFADPQNPDVVYLPNRSIMKSTDGGKTFTAIKGAPGGDDYHDLWIDPKEPTHLIFGSDQGAGVSLDGGRTWSDWYNQPTAQFYHVAVDNRFPYLVYGAQQDAGTASVASRSDYGSITFREFLPLGAGESGYLAPDPLDSNLVYGGDTYGGLHRFDRRTGQSQDIAPWPLGTFGLAVPRRHYRFTWTSPLVFDVLDPHALYFGAQVLLRTRDGGLHWDEISPDLTRADPSAANDTSGPVTVANAAARGWGVIYTIAPSPLKSGLIWIGTDDGLVHLTRDGGQHWENVTPEGLLPWSKLSLIEASRHDTGTAYAAVDRHRLDDFAPYFYRTHDFGRTWTRTSDGLAPTAYAQAVREDPARRGLLYAGTELGVYVSFDDGNHWQSLQLDLPTASVRDLVVHGHDLIAATHGRAFWILDDLTALRQLTDTVVRSPVHLFRPERAVRVRRSVSNDTPLPPEIPQGENPPAGAVIDYYLQAAPSGPVALEILDHEGNLVRRYSSADSSGPPREPPFFMDEWLPRQERPTGHAGHHRLMWDLRYPLPPADQYDYSIAAIAGHGTVEDPQGPMVLPGQYQVRLTVGGTSYTQPLTVTMDPRVQVSDSALAAQLRLALEIWNAMAEQQALRRDAGALVDQLGWLTGKRVDAPTQAAITELRSRAERLARALADGSLANLEGVVTSADREPTQPAREAFARLAGQLADARTQWTELVSRDLAALNARLKKAKLAALSAPNVAPRRLVIPGFGR